MLNESIFGILQLVSLRDYLADLCYDVVNLTLQLVSLGGNILDSYYKAAESPLQIGSLWGDIIELCLDLVELTLYLAVPGRGKRHWKDGVFLDAVIGYLLTPHRGMASSTNTQRRRNQVPFSFSDFTAGEVRAGRETTTLTGRRHESRLQGYM